MFISVFLLEPYIILQFGDFFPCRISHARACTASTHSAFTLSGVIFLIHGFHQRAPIPAGGLRRLNHAGLHQAAR